MTSSMDLLSKCMGFYVKLDWNTPLPRHSTAYLPLSSNRGAGFRDFLNMIQHYPSTTSSEHRH